MPQDLSWRRSASEYLRLPAQAIPATGRQVNAGSNASNHPYNPVVRLTKRRAGF
jgi:hypothetical protein